MATQPITRDRQVLASPSSGAGATDGWGGSERLLSLAAAVTLIATGVIHGAQITSHLGASLLAGMFFAGVAVLQLALGAMVLASRSSRVRIAALVATFGTIAVWITSRTFGISVAGHAREAVGMPDAIATIFEIVTAVLVGALLLVPRGRRPDLVGGPRTSHAAGTLAAVAITLAVAATTAVALRPLPPHGHQHLRDEASPSAGNDELLDLLDHHGSHQADHPSP